MELTDDTFDTVVKSKDAILVNFFAPWCTYSKRLLPQYRYAANVLKRNKPPITIAQVSSRSVLIQSIWEGDIDTFEYPL